MKIRNTIPEYGNKFYNTTSNGGFSLCIKGKPTQAGRNVLSNCVGYACGRFNEIIGSMKYPYLNCNAENFIERAKQNGLKISNVPTLRRNYGVAKRCNLGFKRRCRTCRNC